MSQTLLNVASLDFRYSPERPVFQSLNLHIRRGERVGLTGSNGSGKTTLFNMLMGFLRPDRGVITWFGTAVGPEKSFVPIRRKVGYLFQNPDDQLFCPTVGEEIAFGPFNLGYPREDVRGIVAETLAALNLADYENRVTYHLSEGEKRLVSLAAVLAMKPEVLLLDEPTNGLDVHARERITGLLAGLPQSMLIASHDRAFLDALAERCIDLSPADTKTSPGLRSSRTR